MIGPFGQVTSMCYGWLDTVRIGASRFGNERDTFGIIFRCVCLILEEEHSLVVLYSLRVIPQHMVGVLLDGHRVRIYINYSVALDVLLRDNLRVVPEQTPPFVLSFALEQTTYQ